MPGRSRPARRPLLPLAPDRTVTLLIALVVLTFMIGGGSRADIASLPFLRPLALVAAAIGVMGVRRDLLRAYRVPFLLLLGLAVLMIVQLVPLPPALWTQLPYRDAIHQLDRAVGLADVWRPITLSPMRTANSLAALAVPFAVLVLYGQLGSAHHRRVLLAVVALAVLGAVIGFFQRAAGTDSGLYFYAITNRGDAVGLFANRNHHAAFLAAAMLVALHLALERGRRDTIATLCFGAAAVLLAAVVANVSRGGLLSAGVALVLVPLIVPARRAGGGEGSGRARDRWLQAGLLALPAVGLIALFAFVQRSAALTRLLAYDQTEDVRARILPVLLQMARDFQPWGAGFGAFEQAYRMREPAALLVPNYFNNAHNDWLQLAIEGGAGGVALLGLGLAAAAVRIARLWRRREVYDEAALARAWLGLAVLLVLGFASLFDYGDRAKESAG